MLVPRGVFSPSSYVRTDYTGWFNVMNYGAVGDGVADDTEALQTCITAAGVSGGEVFLPPGNYRITSTLVFPATQKLVTLSGAGTWATTITADFAPTSNEAALLCAADVLACFVYLRSFKLVGPGDNAFLFGIVMDYTSGPSGLADLWISGFQNGITIDHSWQLDIWAVTSLSNLQDGLALRQRIDGETPVGCNCVRIFGGNFNSNGRYGLWLRGRGHSVYGSIIESCGSCSIYAYYCYGLVVSGVYSEGSAAAHNTVANFSLYACKGVRLEGLNFSNWYDGTKLIKIESSNGITIDSCCSERGGGTTAYSGYAVHINVSQNVVIGGCCWNEISNGIYVQSNARVIINLCYFEYCTVPVTFPSQSYSILQWHGAYATTLAASSIGANARRLIDTQEGLIYETNFTHA